MLTSYLQMTIDFVNDQFSEMAKTPNSHMEFHSDYQSSCCIVRVVYASAELAPSVKQECHFAKEHFGRWSLFDDVTNSEITFNISDGLIRTSHIGSFLCKAKHWKSPYYKVLTNFENGWSVS